MSRYKMKWTPDEVEQLLALWRDGLTTYQIAAAMRVTRNTFDVTFHLPTAHRFDADNLVSRFKAGQDALAEIAGVDDSEFVMTYRKGEPRKGGAVVIV